MSIHNTSRGNKYSGMCVGNLSGNVHEIRNEIREGDRNRTSNDTYTTHNSGSGSVYNGSTINNRPQPTSRARDQTDRTGTTSGSNSDDGGETLDIPTTTRPSNFKPITMKLLGATGSFVRALVLVINIHFYKQLGDEPADREGSLLDVDRCVKFFERFGCGVYVPETKGVRVTHEHISDCISTFKSKFVGCGVKACFVVVMGHGKEGGQFGDSDHVYRSIESTIFSQFDNRNFKAMINKPKIMLTNCCRGSTDTPPVYLDAQPGGRMVPTVTDMLIFWSTCPENYSIRHSVNGSLFVEILSECFEDYALHLEEGGKEREIRVTFEKVVKQMSRVVNRHLNLTQIPNIDLRAFGKFTLLLNDSIYEQLIG